ncbi:MAG TPA: thioredoxin family protein [Cyclobacteriaceae bacterium]|nr:thioredoxin family protein [Cyclobacteriaceae bacterium]
MKNWSKSIAASLLFFGFSNLALAQFTESAEDAFRQASDSGKSILLIFSGSDWCAPCMQLDKKVLSTNQFQNFAGQELIVLKADFPQRRKIEKWLSDQNDALAERYNPQGIFPYLVLLNPDKSSIGSLKYDFQTPEQFIEEVKAQLSKSRHGKT